MDSKPDGSQQRQRIEVVLRRVERGGDRRRQVLAAFGFPGFPNPTLSLYSIGGVAAQALARARIRESVASSLADCRPPAWVYLHGLKSPLSSTALRNKTKP